MIDAFTYPHAQSIASKQGPISTTEPVVIDVVIYCTLKMKQLPGPRLNIGTVFPGMGILMLKIRRSRNRLIFNMGIPILVRRHLYIETVPSFSSMIPGEWFLRHAFCNTIKHRHVLSDHNHAYGFNFFLLLTEYIHINIGLWYRHLVTSVKI